MELTTDPSSIRTRGRRMRWRIRIGSLAIALGLAAWAFVIEPSRLVRHDVAIASAHWPAGAAPMRVAVIGDIHPGSPYIDGAKIDRLVALANEAEPDAVFLLGDYVIHGVPGGRFMPPEDLAPHLANLRSRYGTYAVLGNHDWWYDGPRVRRALESAHITVLDNEAARIDRGSDRVYVVGLADPWTRTVDLPRAFTAVPDGTLRLVLVHEPDFFPHVPDSVAVTFAAHTHGGQVRLPFIGSLIVPSEYGQRYAAGHVREGGRDLFVTTGVGTSILPVRFGVPPEVAIVTVGPAR
jgi:predicted MPP superfamily phosphohydrolase